jgi:hypothetical protein
MFENLDVKDTKEAHDKYMQIFEKQRMKHASEMSEMQRKHSEAIARLEIRNEELKSAVKVAQVAAEDKIPKGMFDKLRQENRETVAKWEEAMRRIEKEKKQAQKDAVSLNMIKPAMPWIPCTNRVQFDLTHENKALKGKAHQYKVKNIELSKDAMRASSMLPTLQTKIQGLERTVRIAQSDLKYHTAEAEKYKNMVYGLQVDLESVEARLSEEIQTLKDKLRLVEGERDALKTSLKEEEVLRIAAEGRIPLPTSTAEEQDEFASPIRSPRKQRIVDNDEDKENVAPRKATVELKLIHQQLASEKRLRERAQDQIDFMKMECQFRCCSCRIADMKGSPYVHDGSYTAEMERIKASVPQITPPPSSHGDDSMEGITIKAEPMDEDIKPSLPPMEAEQSMTTFVSTLEQPKEQIMEMPDITKTSESPNVEGTLQFSPTSGTFRSLPSPVKSTGSANTAAIARAHSRLSNITDSIRESSVWNPDANSTEIHHEDDGLSQVHAKPTTIVEEHDAAEPSQERPAKPYNISIHEDAVAVSDEENSEPQTPLLAPSGPATPYLTRTITTTTTIPLHFSPFTPATKDASHSLTPSTVAHAPTNAQSNALGEVSLNSLPIDRAAALEAIRQRRGRARSMAAGNATPRKQMMEGVKERRDISAPVARVGR